MEIWSDFIYRVRALFFRRKVERELDEELRFHLDLETEKHMRAGVTEAEAHRKSRVLLGGMEKAKEECRDSAGTQYLNATVQDARYALRQLRQSPAFTLVALLSLAIGIGANSALFQLVNAVRLRTLPVEQPGELVELNVKGERTGNFTSRYSELTYPLLQQIATHQSAFSGLAAWSDRIFNLAPGGEVRRVSGLFVNGGFFSTLGVRAQIGRMLTEADDLPACGSPVAVISDRFWRSELSGSPDAVDRVLRLDGHPVTVVGVTDPEFFGVEVGAAFDIAVPFCTEKLLMGDGSRLNERDNWWLGAIARLRPGWTAEQTNAYLRTVSPGLFAATLPVEFRPDDAKGYLSLRMEARPAMGGVSWLRRRYGQPLWLLLAATGVVLLIACANLANLLLARNAARAREFAVRLAVGASHGRLFRQLLAESFLLAAAGSLLGVAIAAVFSSALVGLLATTENAVLLDLRLDLRVLAFTLVIAGLTCVLFGLAPALQAGRVAPSHALKAGARGVIGDIGRLGLRRMLVVAQVALSLVLLVGALLFTRSLAKILAAPAGFHPEGVLVTAFEIRNAGFPPERRPAFQRELLERMRALPGVKAAALSSIVPLSGWGADNAVWPDQPKGQALRAGSRFSPVSSDYFRVLGTSIIAGRDFNAHDIPRAPLVAIVNEAFARKFFAGANPVGQRIRTAAGAGQPEPVYQIVGMVANTKYYSLDEEFPPIVFPAVSQHESAGSYARYVVRAAGPLADVTGAITAAATEMHPAISVQFETVNQYVRNTTTTERLLAALTTGFSVMAVMLAALGLYGVMAYLVSLRRNEIGVRIALGASPASVLLMVVRQAVWLVTIGLALGVGLSLLAGRSASAFLYELKPHDPATIAASCAGLLLVALAAAYAPARRAATVDPAAALRED